MAERQRWRSGDGVLGAALGLSLALHAGLLAVHFRFPDASRFKSNQPLEVVLVNAKTRERPAHAEVLAQSNLDRGGNADEQRRARTPLPVTQPRQSGKDLADAQRRVRELEAQQRELLATVRESPARVPLETPRQEKSEEPSPRLSGRDLADLSLAAMRLEAQIDKQLDAYQKRPRKMHLGARTVEYRFAQYEEDWRMKVERIGTLNYPPEARGKLYGNLQLTVTIKWDGSVVGMELDRSSGLKVLDAAALKIVKMASPYASFPPDIRREFEELVITRTWFFGQGDKLWSER